MRWILVSLLLLNFLYFGWSYWHDVQGGGDRKSEQVVFPAGGKGSDDLVLLTERLPAPTSSAPPPSITPERPKAQPPQMPRPQAPSLRVCARVGPFENEAARNAILKRLGEAGLKAISEPPEANSVRQYWVLLPPADSRRRALQTLRELQARKVDSYLIASGDMRNAISLGLFSREELARGVQEKIREAGYPAEIQPKDKPETRFWVQVIAEQPFENAGKLLDSLVSDQSGIKISNTSCEMFAQ